MNSAAAVNIDFWSVHGPVRPSTFWSDDFAPALATSRQMRPSPDLLVGGDWNALPDPSRDSLHGTSASCPWSPIAPILATHELTDIDRHLRPEERLFSRIVRGPRSIISSAKRLDSLWAGPRLLTLATTARYVDTTSDHRAVSILFHITGSRPVLSPPGSRSWSTWVLHPGVLRSPAFRRAIETFILDLTPPPGPRTPTNPIPTWTAFERRLRSVAQIEGRSVGHALLAAQASVRHLELCLERLDLSNPNAGPRMTELLRALRTARLICRDTAKMNAINPALTGVFRPSTWLHRANNSHERTRIHTLLDSSGFSGRTDAHLLTAAYNFFQSLYTPNPISAPRISHTITVLSMSQTRFPPAQWRALGAPFSEDELSHALTSAKLTSAPGPNGLTYPLMRLAAPLAVPLLTDVANSMRAGHPMAVALRTTLLHKRGPRNDLTNYRPISVSDVHVRILTRAAALRLQAAIALTLPWNQTAFMPGRRASSIIGALQGCAEQVSSGRPGYPSSFVAIFLDQQKAYDRVDRSWLWAVLLHFGVPQSYISFVQSLYSSPSTQVVLNGMLTSLIALAAGLLQGDPLSCSLYNITLQPLLDMLTHLHIGIEIPGLGRLSSLAFADDVTIILPLGPEGLAQWNRTLYALSLYESASGARLNHSKSGYFVVSSFPCPEGPKIPSCSLYKTLASLGAPGSPCAASFAARLAAIGARIQLMESTGTDLLLRVRLCNSLLTPMLWHHSSIGGLPLNAGKLLRQTLRPFLFKGKRSWIEHAVITLPRTLGGLGLIDPDAMFIGQTITFLAHHLLEDEPYGLWLRHNLAHILYADYGCSPAVFLTPGTVAHKRLSAESTRASGFWGRLLHALCTACVTLDPSWPSLPTQALLELPWYGVTPAPPAKPDLTPEQKKKADQKALQIMNRGWLTWGDILWRQPVATPSYVWQNSWPLGPPGPRDAAAHHIPRPGAPQDNRGPQLGQAFSSLWSALPTNTQTELLRAQVLPFEPPTDLTRARPLCRNPSAPHFPWHLLLVDGTQLQATSCRKTRLARCSPQPAVVDWKDERATASDDWAKAWTELHAVPLPSAAISSCFLWMHRRAWLANTGSRVDPCPSCASSAPETQEHAYVECPHITTVWTAATPVLKSLGITASLPLSGREVALCWPSISKHRARLTLWRTAVIHTIAGLRAPALARFRKGAPLRFPLPSTRQITAHVAALVAEGIQTAWDRLKNRPSLTAGEASKRFDEVWANESSFVRRAIDSDTTILFDPPSV